jgi:small subunit ribosomal protein S13
MARIAGINLPKEKRIEAALTLIIGIGRPLSKTILLKTGVDLNKKVGDLNEAELDLLRTEIAKHPTEGENRRLVSMNIKRLQDVGSLRGFRHKKRLPVRGQRTKTNARTKRGKRVTMGSGRKKETKT